MEYGSTFLISAKHGYGVGEVLVRCRRLMEEMAERGRAESGRAGEEALEREYRRRVLEKELLR